MTVVVFGDFTCAFSYLASRRVDRLAEHGIDVAWLAVHRPIGPGREERPSGNVQFEIMAVESWLERDEALRIRAPGTRPDTSLAVAALAATRDEVAPELRRRLYDAYWIDGRDIGDRGLVEQLAGHPIPRLRWRARRWHRNWVRLGCPELPAVILEDGTLVRGGEAVDELTLDRRLTVSGADRGVAPRVRGPHDARQGR
jgi:predicted DsbA family dithiol-disulfide isomerase